MFVEQRLYTCAPGQTGEFLRVYEREGRAPQMQHLGQPVGYYISEIGTLNQVTTLWAYGSLDERVERRRALFQNADWNAYLNKARPLLTTQETRILVPAPFFQERLAAIASLGGRHDGATDRAVHSGSVRLRRVWAGGFRRGGAGRLSG